MNKVKYTKVIIEGFQSISEQMVFNLDNVGLNFVKAPNGFGKSTIFNSIVFADYGIDFKDGVVTWKEDRHEGFRGTRVVTEKIVGDKVYRVARHIGFKGKTTGRIGGDKLMVFCRGVDEPKFTKEHLLGEKLHKSGMQDLIYSHMGIDSKTYVNSIFFAQKSASLAVSSGADKREIFDSIFDSSFIDSYKDKAKVRQDELLLEYSDLDKKKSVLDSKITAAKEKLESDSKVMKQFNETKKERVAKATTVLEKAKSRISTNSKDLKSFEDSKKAHEAVKKELETCSESLQKLDTLIKSLEDIEESLSSINEEVDKTKSTKNKYDTELSAVADTCPECSQKLNKKAVEAVKKSIKDKIKKEDEVLKTLDKKRVEKQVELEEEAQLKSDLEIDLLTFIDSIIDSNTCLLSFKEDEDVWFEQLQEYAESRIKELDNSIVQNKKDATKIKEDHNTAKLNLKEEKQAKKPKIDLEAQEASIKQQEEEAKQLNEDLEKTEKELTAVKWWVSKGFSSSGIKSYIFNTMLSKLNAICLRYASRLGFTVEFAIDMAKARKPILVNVYKRGLMRSYKSLSGGQKQRVDICISFAMHELITSNVDINILVLDEVFDGLDSAGIEVAFDLIREKAKTKSVYLISHRKDIDSLNARNIDVKYENGRTSIT